MLVLINCSMDPNARQLNSLATASARAAFSSTTPISSTVLDSCASWW
jgi:hypothetical protein